MKRRRSDVTSLLANGSAPSGKERDSGPRVFSCRFRTPLARRPCESRDPYAVPSRCGTESETFHNNERRWLWVPAFAGTTSGAVLATTRWLAMTQACAETAHTAVPPTAGVLYARHRQGIWIRPPPCASLLSNRLTKLGGSGRT